MLAVLPNRVPMLSLQDPRRDVFWAPRLDCKRVRELHSCAASPRYGKRISACHPRALPVNVHHCRCGRLLVACSWSEVTPEAARLVFKVFSNKQWQYERLYRVRKEGEEGDILIAVFRSG